LSSVGSVGHHCGGYIIAAKPVFSDVISIQAIGTTV